VPTLGVAPSQATVAFAASKQFIAAVTDAGDDRVTWSVDGVPGGNGVVGTITPNGLYRAPLELSGLLMVTIQARSVGFPQLVTTVLVSLVPPSTSVVASPHAVWIVRPGTGATGGLPLNLTAAAPSTIVVVRPGTGDDDGLPTNLTVAAPSAIVVVRPGGGNADGLGSNVTVAQPPSITAIRPGMGDQGGLNPNVTSAAPPSVTVVRPGAGPAGGGGLPPNTTTAQPPDIRVTRP